MLELALVVLSILGLCGVIDITPICIVALVYATLQVVCIIIKRINH